MRARIGDRLLLLLFVGILPVAGCAIEEEPATGWTVTMDTLATGVTQAVNSPPAGGTTPQWTLEPELLIGSIDGSNADAFGQIKGIAPLGDGGVAILDAQSQEIRVFNTSGDHVRTLGRRGEGPGEMSDATGMLIGADGLLRVNDRSSNRLSFFDPSSGFVRSVDLGTPSYEGVWPAVVDSMNNTIELTGALLPDGPWEIFRVMDAEGTWTDTIRVERRTAAPQSSDAPGTYVVEFEDGRWFVPIPYWPRSVFAMDHRGYVWTREPHVNRYRITQLTFDRDTVLQFESRRPPLTVTTAERDSVINEIRNNAEGINLNLDWSLIPTEHPIVEAIVIDDNGRVWVQVRASNEGTTYDIFGRDGVYQGTVATDLRVITSPAPVIIDDLFYGVVTDELNVQYVVRARMSKVGP